MRSELIASYYSGDEYFRKLRERVETMKQCEDDLNRTIIIADHLAVNPVEFIETICVLKIPEYQNAVKPFFLFQYQKDILWKLVEAERSGQDVEMLVDKLRGMGMTWLIAAYCYWRWLFTPNWSCLILSRTEVEVDDGTSIPDNSIFGKIRFFIEHTPEWLIPEGFDPKGKKGTSTDSSLKLINPAMDTSINGSSTNSNAGRGRRVSFVWVDECFYIQNFQTVWRALQSVSRVALYVSSVKQGRVAQGFKEKCEKEGHYITLSWRDHPWKDEQWYKEKLELAKFDPEVTKEFEVDYSVNIENQYYPEVRQSTVMPLEYNRERPLYAFLDFGKQDLTVIIWAQYDGRNLDVLDGFAAKQKPLDFYVPFLNPESYIPSKEWYNEEQWDHLQRVRSWHKPRGYFGEAAHFNKVMPLNISIAQILFRHQIRLICNKNAIKYDPRRHATSLILPHTRFNEKSEGAMELYDALCQSRYVSTNSPISKETAEKPKHDPEIADWRAAFENGACCLPIVMRSQRHEVQDPQFASSLAKRLRV